MKRQYCELKKVNGTQYDFSLKMKTGDVVRGCLVNGDIEVGKPFYIQTQDGAFCTADISKITSAGLRQFRFKTKDSEYELTLLSREDYIEKFTGASDECKCVRRLNGTTIPCFHDVEVAKETFGKIEKLLSEHTQHYTHY